MTIFDTVQFPAFDGVSKSTQPVAPQFSLPDDEAIQVFQQAYERPSELPQPVELPLFSRVREGADETVASVVERPQPSVSRRRGRRRNGGAG